ncbi:MAG: glycosyltransferase family 2 protein [Syntrophaceae bacterium]
MINISIIIPVRNEAASIGVLAQELTAVMRRQAWPWECIWVDDGSTDGSLSILRKLSVTDSHHRFIAFEHNAGQSAALWAGFKEAGGEMLATIDGDGQNDPADIPILADIVRLGKADMVNGYRAQRHDCVVRFFSSKIANAFRNMMTGKTVKDVGCSTRVFRRECVECLPQFAGMHRFLPTLAAMQGFRLAEIPVNDRPRRQGQSKYGINNRLWVGLVDLAGVYWLRKRSLIYTIREKS